VNLVAFASPEALNAFASWTDPGST
jgi:hypothetical protein